MKHQHLLPELHGLGIAHLLMHELLAQAQALGYHTERLDTAAELDNPSLYKKDGFGKLSPLDLALTPALS